MSARIIPLTKGGREMFLRERRDLESSDLPQREQTRGPILAENQDRSRASAQPQERVEREGLAPKVDRRLDRRQRRAEDVEAALLREPERRGDRGGHAALLEEQADRPLPLAPPQARAAG